MKIRRLWYLNSILFLTASLSGCLKKTPDVPPDNSNQNPNISANTSIADIKKETLGGRLLENTIISGVIVMSDKSGNLYQKIIVQDQSGGIEVLLEQQDLYAELPPGRRVFIKCGGLFVAKKNGIMQLGGQTDANGFVSPISSAQIKDFIFPGQFPVAIKPDSFCLEQLATAIGNEQQLNTLVVVKNVEFADSNINVPYALPPNQSAATERILQNCSGATIPLQTSAYANFQAQHTPAGHGWITAIYTAFRGQPYLLIRDTADLQFHQPRCHALPDSGQSISITQLKQLFSGQSFNLPTYRISGLVISDKVHQNTAANQVVLQGNATDAGVILQFDHPVSYLQGDSLVINTAGAIIYNNYGTIALKNLSDNRIQVVGHGKTIRPTTATISQIRTSPQSYASRLTRISDIYWTQPSATLNGQSGNLYFSDGTDTMAHFCEQTATFKNDPIIDSNAAAITGYIIIRNQQIFLKMRNPENDLEY